MKKFLSLLVVFTILAVTCINAFAATVGQQLLSPEEGWSRYDNTASEFNYIGSWTSLSHINYYNSTYCETLVVGSKVQFNFIGSKLRILTTQDNVNHNAGKHTVYIDGVNCGTYEYLPNTSLIKCKLLYEKVELTYKEHFVEVVTEDCKNTTNGATWDCIDIGSTGSLKPYAPSVNDIPANVTAAAGNNQVSLSWNSVSNAAGYYVKRSATSGRPYTVIADNINTNTYNDMTAVNGTAYYYVVSANISGAESNNSNEVSATPAAPVTPPSSIIQGNRAILVITMTNGNTKEYDMSAAEIEAFVKWYDDKENGVAGTKSYFVIKKNYNIRPFLSRQDFIIFNKIQDFEIKDYNE